MKEHKEIPLQREIKLEARESGRFKGYDGTHWSNESLKPDDGATEISPQLLLILLKLSFPYERYKTKARFTELSYKAKKKLIAETIKKDVRIAIYGGLGLLAFNLYKKAKNEGFEIDWDALFAYIIICTLITRNIAPYLEDSISNLFHTIDDHIAENIRSPRSHYDYSQISYGAKKNEDDADYPTHA